MSNQLDIKPVAIEEEMKRSYLDYAMSVIVARALPDVRDGLKPVHRRILYAMYENGNTHDKPHRKSSNVVGYTMMRFHPHGNMPIYDALARMAQDFSLRLLLVDGQGNFGSIDGDPPAAERYTEARLSKPAHQLLEDIDKGTVDFQPNYDDSTQEPKVLPARYPNLLVNGANGIAVGMATNIPSHNLGEVIDACCALITNPDLSDEEMMTYVQGPDFPTGAIIVGRGGIREAFRTGKGSIIIRAKTHLEKLRGDREAIIVDEIPYQVNKARMIERIAEMVKEKTIEGISDLRDESDRDGIRVVIELKKDAVTDVILNQLYRYTPLQTSFGINMLALNHGRPEQMPLKKICLSFLEFREDVIVRRARYELKKAREKAHVFLGLALGVVNLDALIAIIRAAPDRQTAKAQLMEREWPAEAISSLITLVEGNDNPETATPTHYRFSDAQAQAILDLRLHRLTGLEREKIAEDLRELGKLIAGYLTLLGDRKKILELMRTELFTIKEQFATPRRTLIEDAQATVDVEDLIQREDMVVTVSMAGYIKRVPLSTYRAQHRGGKGRSGMGTRDEDVVNDVFVANTHSPILFFTSIGKVYQLKTYRLPLGNPTAKGRPMVNLLPMSAGETVSTVMVLPEDELKWQSVDIMFATSKGNVRRNRLSDFLNIKASGKIAMKLEPEETLISAQLCQEQTDDVILSTYQGKLIRFHVNEVRLFAGRDSNGVRGIRLLGKDRVIKMAIVAHTNTTTEERDSYARQAAKLRQSDEDPELDLDAPATLAPERFAELMTQEQFFLCITEKGYGKRSSSYEYRCTGRGGQGIDNIIVNIRNGGVVTSLPVHDNDQIVLVSNSGQLIRCRVNEIRIIGRRTQGVRIFNLAEDERVVAVSLIKETEKGDTIDDDDTPSQDL